MLEKIVSLLSSLSAVPQPIWAMLGGTLVSWGVTQRLKDYVSPHWHGQTADVAVRAIAFTAGALATVGLWSIGGFASLPHAATAALIVGLWSPATWDILTMFIGWKWPRLRFLLTRCGHRINKRGGDTP